MSPKRAQTPRLPLPELPEHREEAIRSSAYSTFISDTTPRLGLASSLMSDLEEDSVESLTWEDEDDLDQGEDVEESSSSS